MRSFYFALAATAALFGGSAFADTFVNGYYRQNGTYVQPHYRSSPNNSVYDNYSTRGNVNPYTGRAGTVDVTPNYGPGSGYGYGSRGRSFPGSGY